MRLTLRSLVLAPVVLVAVAFTANSAMAESTVTVPFNFSVNGKTCPAGQYTVQADKFGSAVRLMGASRSFTWLIHSGSPSPSDRRVVLQFDQVGARRFLRTIQYQDQITSRLDKRSRELESASMTVETVQGQ
jgi:hypothetical protein